MLVGKIAKTLFGLQMVPFVLEEPLASDVLTCQSQAARASKKNGKDNAKSQPIMMMMTTTLPKPHARGLKHSTHFRLWFQSLHNLAWLRPIKTSKRHSKSSDTLNKVFTIILPTLVSWNNSSNQDMKFKCNSDSNPMSRLGSWSEWHCTRGGKGYTDRTTASTLCADDIWIVSSIHSFTHSHETVVEEFCGIPIQGTSVCTPPLGRVTSK